MTSIDDQLSRLFRAAAQQGLPSHAAPPFGLEARVMASWRDGQSDTAGFWEVRLLLRGLVVAGLITAASFLPALSSTTSNPFAEFLQLTDSTISTDDTP